MFRRYLGTYSSPKILVVSYQGLELEFEIVKITGQYIIGITEKMTIAVFNTKSNRLRIGDGRAKRDIVLHLQPFDDILTY